MYLLQRSRLCGIQLGRSAQGIPEIPGTPQTLPAICWPYALLPRLTGGRILPGTGETVDDLLHLLSHIC